LFEKNKLPRCINCQGERGVKKSHECPMISRYKMVLSLGATENIPLVEARRKIHQNNSPSSVIRYDFANFPLLNSKNLHHNSYKNIISNSTHTPIQISNQFSALDSLSSSNANDVSKRDPNNPIPKNPPDYLIIFHLAISMVIIEFLLPKNISAQTIIVLYAYPLLKKRPETWLTLTFCAQTAVLQTYRVTSRL